MTKKETTLPGTIPSMRSMIITFLKEQHKKGIERVYITEIYSYLEDRIKDPIFDGRFKLDTFHYSIRGELNHNELDANGKSLKLYKRVSKGYYCLTPVGEMYYGR